MFGGGDNNRVVGIKSMKSGGVEKRVSFNNDDSIGSGSNQ